MTVCILSDVLNAMTAPASPVWGLEATEDNIWAFLYFGANPKEYF